MSYRRVWRVGLGVLLLGGSPARADTALPGTFGCPQREGPGRVVCDLDLPKSVQGSSLVWVDALVLKTPPFVRPLRSRVTTAIAPGGAEGLNLPVAFVAQELGRAEITVRARAVVCRSVAPEPSGCRAVQADFTSAITVGR